MAQHALSRSGGVERFLSPAEAAEVRRVLPRQWALGDASEREEARALVDARGAGAFVAKNLLRPRTGSNRTQDRHASGGALVADAEAIAALVASADDATSARYVLYERVTARTHAADLAHHGDRLHLPSAISEVASYGALLVPPGASPLNLSRSPPAPGRAPPAPAPAPAAPPPRKRRKATEAKAMTDQQRVERRERNREHAKRSRIRKKFLLESLMEQVSDLRAQNKELRQVIRSELPDNALDILNDCVTEESLLLVTDSVPRPIQQAQQLVEPDFRLMLALQAAQQNFAVSDPSLPDNPIVYASRGFLTLTGYQMSQVVGRNCRFLQGPGTDPKMVDRIRTGVAAGEDTSVCLLNYKADGTPFWNQFFVAALRDADGTVVNYVGVQCEVNEVPVEEIKERSKRMALMDI